MLWAQHADASTSPERPERSKVICLRVIVFDCWQLCAHIYACVSKLQALLPFTTNSRSLYEWTVSWRTKTQSAAITLTDQAATLYPDHLSQKDLAFRQEITLPY